MSSVQSKAGFWHGRWTIGVLDMLCHVDESRVFQGVRNCQSEAPFACSECQSCCCCRVSAKRKEVGFGCDCRPVTDAKYLTPKLTQLCLENTQRIRWTSFGAAVLPWRLLLRYILGLFAKPATIDCSGACSNHSSTRYESRRDHVRW